MEGTDLAVRECADGWRVIHGARVLFWRPDYGQAMGMAKVAAAVHADIREAPVAIVVERLLEDPIRVAVIAPSTARALPA